MATVTAMTAAATETALAGKVDKGSLVFNVKDYGAQGDAGTSDDAAILDAISAASSSGNGGIVFFPPGNYLLTSTTALTLGSDGTRLRGAGPQATRIMIGATFTGQGAVMITGSDCGVEDLTIAGANSSDTGGNPAVPAIYVYGGKHNKIINCTFEFINWWCIDAVSDSSGTNPDGLVISNIFAQQCSAGIHLQGNSPNAYVYHGQISDIWLRTIGLTTGAGANMDGLFLEDCQDLELSNINLNVLNGTGKVIHIKGAVKDLFMANVRGTGNSSTAAACLVEDSAGGSPTNVHITNGLLQFGVIGLRVTGGASNLFFRSLRITDCQTHGISIEGSGNPINLLDLGASSNGSGASGTNYDVNWSGTATGVIDDCRFASNIVASGSNGVQKSINVAASGQKVRCINTRFEGSGAAASNWVTNTPSVLVDVSGTNLINVSRPVFNAGIGVKEGTNLRQGTATLVAGTVTINNNSTTANTRIYLGSVTPSGTPGALFVNAHTVGTSFVVKSTSSTDTSVIAYHLVEAA